MFKFTEKLANLRQREKENQESQWRELIKRAATADDLTGEEAELLDRLHRELGVGVDLVEYVTAIAEHGALVSTEGEIKKLEKAKVGADKAHEDHRAESKKIEDAHTALIAQRNSVESTLRNNCRTIEHGINQAGLRFTRRQAMEQSLWKYFGIPDPAIAEADENQRVRDEREREGRVCSVSRDVIMPSQWSRTVPKESQSMGCGNITREVLTSKGWRHKED